MLYGKDAREFITSGARKAILAGPPLVKEGNSRDCSGYQEGTAVWYSSMDVVSLVQGIRGKYGGCPQPFHRIHGEEGTIFEW